MSTLGEGLATRNKLPKTLSRHHFIVEIDMQEKVEDEGLMDESEDSGLISQEVEDDVPLVVVKVSDMCEMVKKGDEVVMSPDHFLRPRTAFKIKNKAYYIYSEHDILGIW